MPTSEPLHVAFVWHMHQPYYRSALSGAFEMPWARMHALKDYGDMVNTLAAYPMLHQTFNLVPCLVEQLETYASGDFVDVYWNHTVKPAADLDAAERAFVVERMCERPTHPRARTFPRYLELAQKRIGEILDRDVVPHFKKGDYGAGLYAGMQSMYRLIGSAHGIDVAPRDSGPAQGGARTGSSHAAVGVALMVVGVMMVFGLFSRIVGRLSGAGYGYGRRCPKCRSRLYVVDRIIRQGSMFGTGLAVKVYRCHSCGFHEEVEYQTRPPVIGPFIGPRWPGGSGGSGGFGGLGGGGSGGGFGGFGGGRSGGGGAGRSW